MKASANVRRAEPTPQRELDGETYSAATRSRSTSTQPIAAPSTATHTSCSRIARATRSTAPRAAHLSACSLDIAGTASARMARRRILASASSSVASARRICITSLPRGLTQSSAALLSLGHAPCVEELASHLVPVYRRPLQDQDRSAFSSEDRGEGTAGNPASYDDHIERFLRRRHQRLLYLRSLTPRSATEASNASVGPLDREVGQRDITQSRDPAAPAGTVGSRARAPWRSSC